jgi:uncharacterized membrane protein
MLSYIIAFILFPLVDSLYLTNIASGLYGKAIKDIQGTDMKINYIGVLGSYLFLIIGLYYFILKDLDYKKPWTKQIFNALILGLVIYGVYEFTNLAIIEKWTMDLVIIDTLWGGLLYAIVTYLILMFQQYYKK